MADEPSLPLPAPGLPPLDSEPEERRRIRPWHLAVVGVLFGYPLSVGPAIWLSKTLDPGEAYSVYLIWIFAPLRFLHRTFPPVSAFYDWYLPFFGGG